MSASKCLTEINKVQSFLKRINGKMADAIFFAFFFFFSLGVVWGKLHFQSNKHHKGLGRVDVGF